MKAEPMFVNGKQLLKDAPLKNMVEVKLRHKGTSYGLTEAGYDLQIAQEIEFFPPDTMRLFELFNDTKQSDVNDHIHIQMKKAHLGWISVTHASGKIEEVIGRFTLASATEEFDIPATLVGNVKDKSTWARQGLSVFNTVAEPQWKGFLTMELVFHGNESVVIQPGQGIAQVLFGRLEEEGDYGDGKYQNQESGPVGARS